MVGDAKENIDAIGITSGLNAQACAVAPPELQQIPGSINSLMLNETNAQGSRALIETKLIEQMASRRPGETTEIGGFQATNQNDLQEQLANVTQTDSRDDNDDDGGFGNAYS